ncbi:hypothetical protein E4U41_007188, partial [Claviceps citrina]
MPRFRRAKYLDCFYCGKRSGLEFDGTVRDFLCLHCDATNYLDQNGEITDPPVATDREATTAVQYVQYAAPQASAASSSSSPPQDDIFCQACLKNQHLFTKSLAQYFPDDPSDPDYPELERNYYRYRRNLEKRYPQVCSDCADRAEARIRQAGYTAKTDHLRRMMTLSRDRKKKKVTTTRTQLDWIDALGKTLWRSGHVLQLLWHLVLMAQALPLQAQSDGGMRDPDDRSAAATATVLLSLRRAAESLPAAETLMRWSVRTGLAAAWWNPYFVQVNRGFTRHLVGLRQWYSFQGLILFFRLIFPRGMADVDDVGGQAAARSGTAKLGAHVAMVSVMTVVSLSFDVDFGCMYILAGRCIRVDTAPLFATSAVPSLAPNDATAHHRQRKEQDAKTFSELFNEALDSADANAPTPSGRDQDMTPPTQSPFNATRPVRSSRGTANGMGWAETPRKRQQQQQQEQQFQYDEEMDWSPITPQQHGGVGNDHLTPGLTLTRKNGFGKSEFGAQTPSQGGSMNPFRLKVPAAPVEPARRLRSPVWSSAAVKQEQRPETGRVVFTRRSSRGHQRHEPSPSQASTSSEGSGGVEFKQPSFFAPQRDHDTSDSLADLLSQSFSLGHEQEAAAPAEEHTSSRQDQDRGHVAALGKARGRGGVSSRPLATTPSARVELEQAILAALLAVWLLGMHVSSRPGSRGCEIQLGVLSAAG